MTDDDIDLNADGQPGPEKEPKNAKAWLDMIDDATRVYKSYQDRVDNIDKMFGNLEKLASDTRDREFQLFWANIQVLGPSIYSRPPVPVVVPKFKDRRPLPRITSELLERCCIVGFEMEDIDAIMRLVRDDLAVAGRGVPWVLYETDKDAGNHRERVRIVFKDRKDFLHTPARYWQEVDWVASATYPTKERMKERFSETSGDAYLSAVYEDRKDDDADDNKLKAKVWEIWCKSLNKVVWVSEGCEELLDESEPHLSLDGFFPCPRPAYSTVERRTLVPVPDVLFYKDQLEEINELTARLSSLTEAVKVRGFYPAGAGDIGDAIQAAINETVNNQVLIGVSNWSMLGGSSPKDMIVWLPIDMIVATIKELVEQRKQLIDDVYQITGLSDIMRGTTDANETLGAQELKSQYGSVRVKDRQAELVRVARDLTRITAEIMAENFDQKTLLEMSQLEVETDADIARQIMGLEQQAQQIVLQAQQALSDPQLMQQAQENPEQAQQMAQQAKQQIAQIEEQIGKLQEKPTIEKIMAFLRNERLRPYVLDIETDSTIAPDENATKQRATEFITAVGGFMGTALPMVQMVPESATLAAETLKFVASQYRAGRELEGVIEEFADQMKAKAGQPQPNPEAEAAKADQEMKKAELQMRQQEAMQKAQAEAMKIEAERETQQMEAHFKQQESEAKLQMIGAQMQRDQQKGEMEMQMLQMEIAAKQEELQIKRESAQIDAAAKIQQAEIGAASAQQQAEIKAQSADQDARIKATSAAQQADISERNAALKERQMEKADA